MAFGDLTTLADVQAWLSTPGTSGVAAVDIPLVTRLITAASQYIQEWLSRPNILTTDYLEVRDGEGWHSNTFVFANSPVTAVALVIVDGITIPAVPMTPPAPPGMAIATFPSLQAGYLFTPTALTIRGYYVPRKKLCVTLQYTAGYAAVPFDLAQACIELVAMRYKERNRVGEISQTSQPGSTSSYTQKDMTDPIKTLLWKYKMIAPVSAYVRVLAPDMTSTAILAAI